MRNLYSIAILLINMLLIHSFYFSFCFTALYVTTFTFLSWRFKTPEAFENDFYIAGATLIAATIVSVMIAALRQNEDMILRKYEFLSKNDAATGLYNKNTIIALCTKQTEKHGSYPVFVMDLDDFKKVNDNYGHYAGDEVLLKVSDVLRQTFGDDALIGRYGGDEFIVTTKKQMKLDEARTLGEILLKSVASIEFHYELRCSVGITCTREGDTFDSVFKRADDALYVAKHSGKNLVETAE